MYANFSIQKAAVFLLLLLGFTLDFSILEGSEKKEKLVHIVLTPEDAMSYDIENYTTSLINRDLAKKSSRLETMAWTAGMVIGVSVVSGVIFYYLVPPIASILYKEGVDRAIFRGNYVTPPPQTTTARVIGMVTAPVEWVKSAGNTGLGWAGFWTNYWNDFTQGRMIQANLNLTGAVGRNTFQFFKITGTYLIRGMTPEPVLLRYDLKRIKNFDELSRELNTETLSPQSKKVFLLSVAALIANGVSFPFILKKINEIRQKHFSRKGVNTHYLESAYQTIIQNADLACQEANGRHSINIKESDVKSIRLKLDVKKYGNIFYQGVLQSHDDLVALDIADDGIFYYIKDFMCETAGAYSPLSYPVSINDLLKRNGKNE